MILTIFLFSFLEPVQPPELPYQAQLIYDLESDPFNPSVDWISMIDSQDSELWTYSVNAPASCLPLAEGCGLILKHNAPQGSDVSLLFIDEKGLLLSESSVNFFQGAVVSDNMESVLVNSAVESILFSRSGEILSTHTGKYSSVAIDATGTRVALAGDSTVYIYQNSEFTGEMDLSDPYVRQLVFSPTGTQVAALTSTSLELWHQGGSAAIHSFNNYPGSPLAAGFNSDGTSILVGLRNDHPMQSNMFISFIVVDTEDMSWSIKSYPLTRYDETVAAIQSSNDDWLVTMTSGTFLLNREIFDE